MATSESTGWEFTQGSLSAEDVECTMIADYLLLDCSSLEEERIGFFGHMKKGLTISQDNLIEKILNLAELGDLWMMTSRHTSSSVSTKALMN